jgi:hypothetical protein
MGYTMNIKTVEEIEFLISAYKKSITAGTGDTFHKRLNELYLEGQVTKDAYDVMKVIAAPDLKLTNIKSIPVPIDPCGRSISRPTRSGC